MWVFGHMTDKKGLMAWVWSNKDEIDFLIGRFGCNEIMLVDLQENQRRLTVIGGSKSKVAS